MAEKKRTYHQKERRESYKGNREVDSSHYISAKERNYFRLANKNGDICNYRNQEQRTNRSNHNVIDNYLLKQSRTHGYDGSALQSVDGPIYRREVKDRIQQKINVAKETGDINDGRFKSYLKKSAAAYYMDLRQFNGYK